MPAFADMHLAAVINHYKENECMRLAMEDLLYNSGVDIIFNGHCHEYERSNPVYVSLFASLHQRVPQCCMLVCHHVLKVLLACHHLAVRSGLEHCAAHMPALWYHADAGCSQVSNCSVSCTLHFSAGRLSV